MVPPLIALEEHFLSNKINGAVERYQSVGAHLLPKLQSLGDERLKDMDAGSLNLQVLSHTPLSAPADECRQANDQLAEACRNRPKRFAGFAMLPMQDPTAAADELERAVTQLGFVGALVNNHVEGTFYDDEKFWPVFERAVELDVPIYLHPTFASDDMLEHYKGNYSDKTAFGLSTAAWGWHTETGLHILRLFASGLFDKLPGLKIAIGHMGEMLPFAFDRILPLSKGWGDRKRDLKTVWAENIWITTSGYFSLAPLSCLLQVSSVDKIMYSVDYPFSTNEKGLAFVKEMQASDLVDDEQLDKICYRNAEKLLRVSVRSETES
ncbi:hypothetical protein LTR36_005405 [Oleoguttula mirabilis]|uniref:Amidohydrolase-related domain-containing protein n=1 Tax=Oleoguttula mirabilis TaxID=1507867 RepID=A0AAV9JG76_9PEZI|nr:hypothetical protein LTR36_005405 [Oleoguttula mirabilis]